MSGASRKPPGTRPLENLIQRLVKDGYFPDRLDAYATTVRKLGNVGTHTFGEKITATDVYQSLSQLLPILEWYFEDERPDAVGPAAAESTTAQPAQAKPIPRGKRRLLAAVAMAAVLAVGGWLLAGTIFKVKTPDGTIVLDIDQAGAEVVVDGGKIRTIVPGDKHPVEITVPLGKHTLEVKKDGFAVYTREIELKTEKSPPITVKLEPVKVSQRPKENAAERRGFTSGHEGWQIQGNELVGDNPGGKGQMMVWFGDPQWADLDFSFQAMQKVGPAGVSGYFRLKDAANKLAFTLGSC